MCNTAWCDGFCDECKIDQELEKEWQESNSQCPHRAECNIVTIDVKQDKCTTCGKVFGY